MRIGERCIGWTKHVMKYATTESGSIMDVTDQPGKDSEESEPEGKLRGCQI